MPAYIITRVKVEDPALIKEYMESVPPILSKYGGKFLVRGVPKHTLEGPIESRRVVVIEFPTLSDAEAYYHSEEYTAARKLRDWVAVAEFVAVDGYE